jgi:hypothetical protein
MDNITNLELQILITVSQNKNVPTTNFCHLFEHKWKIYQSRLSELVSDGVIDTTTPITGIQFYQLSSKGKWRLGELIEQRERNIQACQSHVKQKKPATTLDWKNVKAMMNSIIHFGVSSE